MGMGDIPLLCAREIPVVGSMPSVVRVLMHFHSEPGARRGDPRVPRRRGAAARRPRRRHLRPGRRSHSIRRRRARHRPDRHLGRPGGAPRAGDEVTGWDLDPALLEAAATTSGLTPAPSLEAAVADADLVVVATPIGAVPASVAAGARGRLRRDRDRRCEREEPRDRRRPALGAGRAHGPVRAGPPDGRQRARPAPNTPPPRVVDGIVWVARRPAPETDPAATDAVRAWIESARRPARRDGPGAARPARRDRQPSAAGRLHVPDGDRGAPGGGGAGVLLLAAGGFRDLTRLAASQSALWSEILIANREQVAVGDRSVRRAPGSPPCRRSPTRDAAGVEETFDAAKRARLGLAAKPTVRAGDRGLAGRDPR